MSLPWDCEIPNVLHMWAERGDITPRQLNTRAPNRTTPAATSEGQLDWHQSRTAGVSYFVHLLRWASSRSALSATTDASMTQHMPSLYATPSGIWGLPHLTLITGARKTDHPRRSNSWSNFSRTASCRLILCPHVLWHTWRMCPNVSGRPHASHLSDASCLPRADLRRVLTVAPLICTAWMKAAPVMSAVPSDTQEWTNGTAADAANP